jgi:hypothetical protein
MLFAPRSRRASRRILDATRDLSGGNTCEDSALFTANPR